eukprot:5703280-Pleurochrysis_carterae.AAC.1
MCCSFNATVSCLPDLSPPLASFGLANGACEARLCPTAALRLPRAQFTALFTRPVPCVGVLQFPLRCSAAVAIRRAPARSGDARRSGRSRRAARHARPRHERRPPTLAHATGTEDYPITYGLGARSALCLASSRATHVLLL